MLHGDLAARAAALPAATEHDFRKKMQPGKDYRRCDDPELRTALFRAGLCREFQRPRPASGRPAIVEVIHDGATAPKPARAGRIGARDEDGDLPTVENIEALLERFRIAETAAVARRRANVNQRIEAIKPHLAAADDSEFDRLFALLERAKSEEANLLDLARDEVFESLSRGGFPESRFIRLISRGKPDTLSGVA